MCTKGATSFLVELLSILKETVCRDGTVAVHLCVLLPFKKRTSIYDFLFAALSGKILQNRFIYAKKFVLKGANSFHCREAYSFIRKLTPFVREAEIQNGSADYPVSVSVHLMFPTGPVVYGNICIRYHILS